MSDESEPQTLAEVLFDIGYRLERLEAESLAHAALLSRITDVTP